MLLLVAKIDDYEQMFGTRKWRNVINFQARRYKCLLSWLALMVLVGHSGFMGSHKPKPLYISQCHVKDPSFAFNAHLANSV